MEEFLGSPKHWIPALIALGAFWVSVVSLIKSRNAQNISKQIGLFSDRRSSLRSMVREIEQTKNENLSSPDDQGNELALTVAKKSQAYEAIFNAYKDCLDAETKKSMRSKIDDYTELSIVALESRNDDTLNESTARYVSSMAEFVIAIEKEPHEELETVSAALERLSM